MEDYKKFFITKYHNLCNLMDRQTVGTELLVYGTATTMFLLAYIKHRPLYLVRPFKKPSHIPDKIIDARITHKGLVRDVKQSGQNTLLLVSHRPLISLLASKNRLLPVKLAGIEVNGNGLAWIQGCLIGREATFLPLSKHDSNYVVSQLYLVRPPQGRLVDISETLLKLRFARFKPDENQSVKKNAKYYKHLAKVENRTKTFESWLASLSRYPWIYKTFYNLKTSLLPKKKLLHELLTVVFASYKSNAVVGLSHCIRL
uniref:Uncharacterized protein n=1 Tax=Glossina austeni TaxID=7395 RepID=A0A1A9VR53_GLOAU